MVALMAVTGAAKSTLMPVYTRHKTSGRVVDDIILNSEQKKPANFIRITTYCEQAGHPLLSRYDLRGAGVLC
ncbi:hypothetical protein PC116_g12098 [Phytophthora cactorum]|nr:hypothetical protein PC120_g5994 [Phytophthora cactorum]KAG3081352.1 hypothetical protein PC121_g6463 [Phytophthora cactorum]KAG4056801.1 hypothetical protein PC123_g8156 [Phytophthora cactorum]KAG4239920.1 hypothetical protein PC116_g12098 [Phytophthora cactorum]